MLSKLGDLINSVDLGSLINPKLKNHRDSVDRDEKSRETVEEKNKDLDGQRLTNFRVVFLRQQSIH